MICGSQHCARVVGLGCFIATATLVALACLHASGVMRGIKAYKIAVGCATGALISALAGTILSLSRFQKSSATAI